MIESSAYLWEQTRDRDFTVDDLCQLLLDEYDVDEKTAHADAEAVAAKWLEIGIIE